MAKKPGVAVQKKLMTRKRLLVIALLSGVVVVFVLLSPYGILTRLRLESEHTALQHQVAEARHIADSTRAVVKRLQNDTLEIERLARERYGYIRPGEEVYIIRRDTAE
ncbi:MAG: septum formation initiator family protein [bacterium]|nr:septum formation initiator family protein [bacterium]